jgi:hypothetical protein
MIRFSGMLTSFKEKNGGGERKNSCNPTDCVFECVNREKK